MAFSRRMASEAGMFLAFMTAGIAFGNIIFIYISLVPFFFIVISMAYRGPSEATVARGEKVIRAHKNEAVTVSLTLNMDNGIGIVAINDPLPERQRLAGGSNFHVFWSDGKGRPARVSYEIECARRGLYNVGPARVECYQHSWMEQVACHSEAAATRLVIEPEKENIKKIKDMRLLSNLPMPVGSVSRLGMKTTDFTEIRRYQPGDPYRTINWKATARYSMQTGSTPYVNEYEKEGKKTVFIFIDAGPWMSLGSTADNVFEHAVLAASGIASFYLEKDMRVGVYAYNNGKFVIPESGRKQGSLILRSLLDVQPDGVTDNGLKRAVKECAGHLVGINPMFIVITMAGKENTADIIGGIKSMRKYTPQARVPPITVLHLSGYSLEASGECEQAAATILEIEQTRCLRALKHAGAFVIPWTPNTKSLSPLLMGGCKRGTK
jgi:uncharacterized protein (DUF58 family)